MNNKRQTIWLVSMLSLMVILSAYYLFTEESGPKAPPLAESTQASNQGKTEGASDLNDELTVVTELTPEGTPSDSGAAEETGSAADSGAASSGSQDEAASADDKTKEKVESGEKVESEGKTEDSSGKKEDEKAEGSKDGAQANETGNSSTAKTEDQVLNEVAAQASSAAGKIEAYQLERANNNAKLYEELTTKLGNVESTAEETAQVAEQMKQLEDREQILYSIEEQLQQKYQNAVVKEENNKYNVVVLSEQMDAKGAASIVDMVMKELKVTQDKVSVQYVTP